MPRELVEKGDPVAEARYASARCEDSSGGGVALNFIFDFFDALLEAVSFRTYDKQMNRMYQMHSRTNRSVGNEDGDGNNIAAGLAQLSEGASTPTSGLGWVAGHAKLAAGQPIDLVGASGPLDFDPETNDVRSRAVTLWRYNLDLGVPETIGQLYDAAGQYRAPEFGGLLTDETCAPYR